jgi:hypothetical protein
MTQPRHHPTDLSFRAQRHNHVCHFRADGREVEKSRGCAFRHADSGSFYEGLSRKMLRISNQASGIFRSLSAPLSPPVRSVRHYPTHCHFERSATTMFAISRRMGAESRNPEDVHSAMLIQGVSARDCPGNLISPPQLSARSCQRGFSLSISQIFFSRRQRLICFLRLMDACRSESHAVQRNREHRYGFF